MKLVVLFCFWALGSIVIVKCQLGNMFDDIPKKLDSFLAIDELETELLRAIHPAQMYQKALNAVDDVLRTHSTSANHEPTAVAATSPWQCLRELFFVYNNARKGKPWALKFVDAWGKPLPGFTNYHSQSYGDFRLCRSLHAEILTPSKSTKVISGKYCSVHLFFETGSLTLSGNLLGMCVPSLCTKNDLEPSITSFLHSVLPELPRLRPIPSVACAEDASLSGAAIVTVCLVVSLVCVTIIATAVHFVDDRRKRQDKHCVDDVSVAVAESAEVDAKYTINADEVKAKEENKIVKKENKKAGIGLRLLNCFSLKRNLPKLLDMSQKPGTMECINGIRFFTLTWIALAHSWYKSLETALNTKEFYTDFINRTWTYIILGGTVATDTFLAMSGIVATYGFLTYTQRSNGKINWVGFYVKRYVRLAPVTIIVVLITGFSMRYWYAAPSTGFIEAGFQVCETTWWQNALFINNLFKNQCVVWTWYLGVDFQLYAVSPLFLIPLSKKPKLGLGMILVAFLASEVYTGWSVYVCRFVPSALNAMLPPERKCDQWSENYTAPWVRCPSYFIGMVTGYILFKTKKTIHIPKFVLALGWALFTLSAWCVFFSLQNRIKFKKGSKSMTDTENVAYSVLYRPVWAVCVAWVIVVCVTKNARPINSLLSIPVLTPLARITFSFYLIHLMMLSFVLYSLPAAQYYTQWDAFVQAAGIYLLTLVASFPTSLIFETPFLNMIS